MADLDDFFAKKDKKKSKGKKFATADEIAKKLEETGKKTEKSKKEKALQNPTGPEGEDSGPVIQEDEWKDFEEEKKDYTGLKIQNLTLNEQELNEAENEVDENEESILEENEAGEMVRRKVVSGPWKVMAQPQNQEDAVSTAEPEKPAVIEEAMKAPLRSGATISGGTYIPPNFRNQPPPQAFQSSRVLKSKAAPDVNNEAMFPTLSAATSAEPAGAWGRKKREEVGFEEVRNSKSHSSRYGDTSTRTTSSKLSLGNKYGALTDQS